MDDLESARWGQVAAWCCNIAPRTPSFIRPSTAAEASITINGLLARPRHLRRRHRRRLRGPAARQQRRGCRRVRWKRARGGERRRATGLLSARRSSARRPRQARSAGASAMSHNAGIALALRKVLITAETTSAQAPRRPREGIDRHLPTQRRPVPDGGPPVGDRHDRLKRATRGRSSSSCGADLPVSDEQLGPPRPGAGRCLRTSVPGWRAGGPTDAPRGDQPVVGGAASGTCGSEDGWRNGPDLLSRSAADSNRSCSSRTASAGARAQRRPAAG